MRASSGLYVSRLDHVRALAAFLVYCWHFVHVHVPYETVPVFPPLSLLEEGHIGVALFMTLSGYLFAKIIDGRPLDLGRFYHNRVLRLAPLLALVLGYWAARGNLTPDAFMKGIILPTWSGGAWSVAVELHFYAVFPLILWMQRGHRTGALVALLMMSILLRTGVWAAFGTVQAFSYWTMGGCIDLFLAGMLWHELARRDAFRRHAGLLLAGTATAIVAAWHIFNVAGGFYGTTDSPLWIVIPTLQGLAFGALIVGYEYARVSIPPRADHALAKVGEVSYSIYLLHFIFYPTIVKQLAAAGFEMANLPVALGFAVLTFPLIVGLAMLSYRFIEQPFLKMRGSYEKTGAHPAERSVTATLTPHGA
jgi:peptidoglycan/LPS O-acetylase OafA/YrhL